MQPRDLGVIGLYFSTQNKVQEAGLSLRSIPERKKKKGLRADHLVAVTSTQKATFCFAED